MNKEEKIENKIKEFNDGYLCGKREVEKDLKETIEREKDIEYFNRYAYLILGTLSDFLLTIKNHSDWYARTEREGLIDDNLKEEIEDIRRIFNEMIGVEK